MNTEEKVDKPLVIINLHGMAQFYAQNILKGDMIIHVIDKENGEKSIRFHTNMDLHLLYPQVRRAKITIELFDQE